jgi:peptidoglycan hydrolase-like protein with peptidoglycan-binding domain
MRSKTLLLAGVIFAAALASSHAGGAVGVRWGGGRYCSGGPIDGAFGPTTNSAVTRYQQDYGLPVAARLDRTTRASLGI